MDPRLCRPVATSFRLDSSGAASHKGPAAHASQVPPRATHVRDPARPKHPIPTTPALTLALTPDLGAGLPTSHATSPPLAPKAPHPRTGSRRAREGEAEWRGTCRGGIKDCTEHEPQETRARQHSSSASFQLTQQRRFS